MSYHFHSCQYVKFTAEKNAQAADLATFQRLYAARAAAFGTTHEAYHAANEEFRTFLQPFIDQARATRDEANHAGYGAHSRLTQSAKWGTEADRIPVHEVEDELVDED